MGRIDRLGEARECEVDDMQGRNRAHRRSAFSLLVCLVAVMAAVLVGTTSAGAAGDDVDAPDTAATPTPAVEVPDGPVEVPDGQGAEAPPAEQPAEEADGIITITQAPLPFDGQCNPLAQAQLTYTTTSDADVFRIVITSATKPCNPIAAAAVAYAMPKGASPAGGQWPQTLVERQDFTIAEASTTTITFAKECDAVQFDVITGESPQTISPTGPWHGPLLFVGDTKTSEQYFPPMEKCGTAPTTVPAPPTTATVQAATTVPQTATNVVTGATVADTTATQGENAAALALTGASSARLALIGAGLLVAGGALFAWSRRSREQ